MLIETLNRSITIFTVKAFYVTGRRYQALKGFGHANSPQFVAAIGRLLFCLYLKFEK